MIIYKQEFPKDQYKEHNVIPKNSHKNVSLAHLGFEQLQLLC